VFGDSYSDIGAGYIDGNGSTAVHRSVGKTLFEEIAVHSPAAR